MWFEELTGLPLTVLEKESSIRIKRYSKSLVEFSIPGTKGSYDIVLERNESRSHQGIHGDERVDILCYRNKILDRYKAGIKMSNCLNMVEKITGTLIG